jgi:CheY-like chemotaxis protein
MRNKLLKQNQSDKRWTQPRGQVTTSKQILKELLKFSKKKWAEKAMFKILVIDDTKTAHAFVNSLLRNVNEISISSAFNGLEAIELIQAAPDFDVILLDWEMPTLTGPQTFQQFKNKNIRIPIIMMSKKNSPEDIQQILQMGITEYIMKPFTTDILLEKIEFVTGKKLRHVAE